MTVHFKAPGTVRDDSRRHAALQPTRRHWPIGGGFYRSAGKTALDYIFILAALPVVLPLMAVLAALIALGGDAPLYWQRRIGRGGKVFHILKFRTMVPDAARVLERHLASDPAARREWDEKQKLCDDPRVTPLGRLLRKTSLDELPQLWNVLRGDMSLVGPRPMMVCQEKLYPGQAYYRMRPGITGLWQVSDRNESTFAGRAAFDTEYYHKLSLKTDLSILGRTIRVVIRGTGY